MRNNNYIVSTHLRNIQTTARELRSTLYFHKCQGAFLKRLSNLANAYLKNSCPCLQTKRNCIRVCVCMDAPTHDQKGFPHDRHLLDCYALDCCALDCSHALFALHSCVCVCALIALHSCTICFPDFLSLFLALSLSPPPCLSLSLPPSLSFYLSLSLSHSYSLSLFPYLSNTCLCVQRERRERERRERERREIERATDR